MKPNGNQAAPDQQEAPAVSPLFQRDTSSKDLVPYPTKPLSPKASRERVAQEQAARKARPLTHLPPGHPQRRAQQPAPEADQDAPPPRRYWQHESDVKHTPAPPKQRDPRNIG